MSPGPNIAGLAFDKFSVPKIHLITGVPSCPINPIIPKAPPSMKVSIIIREKIHQMR